MSGGSECCIMQTGVSLQIANSKRSEPEFCDVANRILRTEQNYRGQNAHSILNCARVGCEGTSGGEIFGRRGGEGAREGAKGGEGGGGGWTPGGRGRRNRFEPRGALRSEAQVCAGGTRSPGEQRRRSSLVIMPPRPFFIWESPPPFWDTFSVLKTADFSKPAEAF